MSDIQTHRRTDTVFAHLFDKPWLTSVSGLKCNLSPHQRHYSATLLFLFGVTRSRLTPDRGLDLLGGPDLLGGMRRPPSRYGVPDPTNLHWHTYGVILKHNSDWLTLGNVLNNIYHKRKLVSRHKNAHCSLDPYANSVWKIRCCETCCLDFDFKEWLRMVSNDDNFIRSPRNLSNNWPEIKRFHCPQREK